MAQEHQMEGGFAYLNDSKGRLENCYAAVRMKKRKRENAGFVYDNRGTVSHCFTRSRTRSWNHSNKDDRNQKDGFSSFNNGTISQSFFLTKRKGSLKNYRDGQLGITAKQADCKRLEELFEWDFTVFEKKKAAKMDFLPENWKYTLPENEDRELICTEEDLTDLIDRINRGDREAACGWYELDNDLDFHGKKLTPLGCDEKHPFEGVFDGNGHSIRGFVLKGKNKPAMGLFGYLQGTVANLRADGIVKGKNCNLTAAFCAVNQGEIHCCEAVVEIHSKYNLGMFVGENHGLIERCSVSGKSCGLFFFIFFPLVPVMALVPFLALNPLQPTMDYNPVAEDRSIIPNVEEETRIRSNENKASYQVPKTIEMDAATLTATDEDYIIKNPDRGANYDFVAAIYMTDSSGEQVEVYRSGRIPVGYCIAHLTLTPPEGVTLSKGVYDAQLVFSFYNQDTGEKGMIDSSVPISIRIQ